MKKSKVIIILLATFFSFVLGSGCYYFFYLSSKKKEVSVPKSNEQKEVSAPKDDVSEVANRDLLLLLQEVIDYGKKLSAEKNINRENISKNIEILKDRGIWEKSDLESDHKKYLDDFQSANEAFQLQLKELLKKAKKKEKNLESFREELKKIGEENKKKSAEFVERLAKLAERIQEEVQPMPFLATWIGLIISVITGSIISIPILKYLEDFLEDCCDCGEKNFLVLINFFLCSLIFPLINCLLSLKISTFKEIYKHYIFYNCSKIIFLILSVILIPYFIVCCEENYQQQNNRGGGNMDMIHDIDIDNSSGNSGNDNGGANN